MKKILLPIYNPPLLDIVSYLADKTTFRPCVRWQTQNPFRLNGYFSDCYFTQYAPVAHSMPMDHLFAMNLLFSRFGLRVLLYSFPGRT